jgi:hypothetical protein
VTMTTRKGREQRRREEGEKPYPVRKIENKR